MRDAEQEDFGEVLKWSVSVGGGQRVFLLELEKKTGQKFHGDIWTFVKLARDIVKSCVRGEGASLLNNS